MSDRANRLLGAPERRALPVENFEVRADVDELVLEGYAAVFGTPYEVFGGPERGGWMEIVDRRAFDRTLAAKPDVHLLVNHEGMPLARTRSGTMDLSTDRRGLKVVARLDRGDPDVQRLAPKMRRGDMDEMSFAFRTVEHKWNEEESERTLLEVSIHKGDVSIVNFGANPATTGQLRHLSDALDLLVNAEPVAALAELRNRADRDLVSTAHRALGDLLRRMTPASRRPLSVSEAEALIATR